ncbi:peptidase M23 [Clostridium sp. CAG:793]|nr:peptidase M23 [Clostridium sp. CAG:793]
MKKNKNRIISSIIIIFIILNVYYSVLADENITNENKLNENSTENRTLTLQEQQNQVKENLNNANIQLQYVENELTSSLIQVQKLQDRIDQYQAKLDEVNEKYQKLQNQVEEHQKKLDTIQESYNRKNEALKQRLVAFYKSGSINFLDVLMDSNNIIDFVSRYYLIKKMTEYDAKSMEEIEKQKQEIEKVTNELKESKANMKLTKADAEQQTVVLTNTKTILENQISSLTESEQSLKSQIDIYKKQQEELENLIQYAIRSSTYELRYSGGIMVWPTLTTSYITSQYGSRLHPIQGIIKNHAGIDIGGSTGNPVYAAADGVIIYSQYNTGGYGNLVMIDHGTNSEGVKIVTLYGHGNKLLRNVGESVKQGELIMEMGSTGNSTGPHVHFEVRENGVAVDPKKYLSSNQD